MHPIKHFRTVSHHRHEVIKLCFKCGIGWQGLKHDLSKYSPTEFIPGAKYYTGTRSPNEGERAEFGYSAAWLHHKGRNKHHFEYWNDYNPQARRVLPVPMPTRYVAEMFCDRVAACKTYRGNEYTEDYPLMYFLNGKKNRFMHDDTTELIEGWLTMLRDRGEKETTDYIKNYLKEEKNGTLQKRKS